MASPIVRVTNPGPRVTITVNQRRGAAGAAGADGEDGATGPAPSGTGLVSVTSGVLDTPSTLSARVAADAANLRTQLGLGDAATKDSSEGGNGAADGGKVVAFGGSGQINADSFSSEGIGGATSLTGAGLSLLNAGGTAGVNISCGNQTELRDVTFPDASGTIALLEGSQTFTGALSFSSTTRPTSAGTGTPAATSLITRADAEALFGAVTKIVVSSQTDNATTSPVDVTGLTGIVLKANTWYRLEASFRIGASATGGWLLALVSSAALETSGSNGYSGLSAGNNTGSGVLSGWFYNSSTNITISFSSEVASTRRVFIEGLFLTGASAPTVKVTLQQRGGPVGTTSVLAGSTVWLTER